MKITAFTILTSLILFSCNKDDCTISAGSIAAAYKITAVTYKANASTAEVDYFNILFPDACDRDNIYTFNSAGTYQISDAGVVCTPPGNDNGTWSLTSTTAMVIDGDPVILESFDCKTLVIVNTDTQTPGDRLKLTLTKQ